MDNSIELMNHLRALARSLTLKGLDFTVVPNVSNKGDLVTLQIKNVNPDFDYKNDPDYIKMMDIIRQQTIKQKNKNSPLPRRWNVSELT